MGYTHHDSLSTGTAFAVSASCPFTGTPCAPGHRLLDRIGAALTVAAPLLEADFAMSGTATIPACPHAAGIAAGHRCPAPCVLLWHADRHRLSSRRRPLSDA